MTKREYIEKNPKSVLARELKDTFWDDDTKIEVVASYNGRNTELSRAIERSKHKAFVVGGVVKRGEEERWFAVA